MNLWLRMLWTFLFSRYRAPVDIFGQCATPYRVWPTDLDILRHVNNGKYFSMMDLARVDLMIRSGVLKEIERRGYYPVIATGTLRFRRSLTLFQKFEIRTRLIGWDERFFFLEQLFYRSEECVASGVIKARFMKKTGGSVDPDELFRQIGENSERMPTLPEWARQWSESVEAQAASLK